MLLKIVDLCRLPKKATEPGLLIDQLVLRTDYFSYVLFLSFLLLSSIFRLLIIESPPSVLRYRSRMLLMIYYVLYILLDLGAWVILHQEALQFLLGQLAVEAAL